MERQMFLLQKCSHFWVPLDQFPKLLKDVLSGPITVWRCYVRSCDAEARTRLTPKPFSHKVSQSFGKSVSQYYAIAGAVGS